MDYEKLKQVIFDNHKTIRKFKITKRESQFDLTANYVVVGIRRAGKSTLLYKLARDLVASGVDWNQIIYINFEDERLDGFCAADFNDILSVQAEMSDKEGWFFFDEIQIIEDWEKFARRMADAKEHTFITGSNAKMLSSEVEERLGGRYLTQYVTTYNFREYLTAKGIAFGESAILGTKESGAIRREFAEYFSFGGFPESLEHNDKRSYVSSVYQKILLGDIASRNNIRNSQALKLLIKKIAETVKDEVSYSKLHNILKTVGVGISKDAVIDYIGYAKDSYLIFPVRNYFSKFIEKETTPKYYFTDNGLLNLFLLDKETRLLENLVALTLHNRFDEVYFLRSKQFDVDFFVPQTGTAYQVAWSLKNITDTRETDSLIRAAQSVEEAKHLTVITYEEEDDLVIDGRAINVVPLWKWVLEM
ncbi:MAG: ATP-binding protein [Treponema sp.]|nr:ATP-binding protein [Treponema sp.]